MDMHMALMLALVAIGVCSVVVALSLPIVVTSALRGNGRGAARVGGLIVALIGLAFVLAAIVGANPAAYDAVL